MRSSKTQLAETARLLNSAAIHLLRGMRTVDRLSGLTPARLSALSVLVFVGPCTLGRLAEIEDVAGSTMTRIVDGLAELGLSVREPHPDSARSVRISATEAGRELMLAAAQRRIDRIVAALGQMSKHERDGIVDTAAVLLRLSDLVRAAT
jgi:DNA-binding MarR family transcriptional regulator